MHRAVKSISAAYSLILRFEDFRRALHWVRARDASAGSADDGQLHADAKKRPGFRVQERARQLSS